MLVVLGQADSDLSVYNTAGPYSDGDSSYITAAWDEDSVSGGLVPGLIVVGDGVVYIATVGGTEVMFRNVALRSNTQYSLFTRYDIANELDADSVRISKIERWKPVDKSAVCCFCLVLCIFSLAKGTFRYSITQEIIATIV